MEKVISKEELDKLKKVKGEIRGAVLLSSLGFILKDKGEEGLKKVEEAVNEFGYPLKYIELKPMAFYPVWLDTLILISAKKVLNYDDEKIKELGEYAARTNFLMRLLIKYFVSISILARAASTMWKRYHTVGNLESIKISPKEKIAILRLENFKTNPVDCKVFEGYLTALAEITLNSKVICEETKCMHRGDKYHEFKLTW